MFECHCFAAAGWYEVWRTFAYTTSGVLSPYVTDVDVHKSYLFLSGCLDNRFNCTLVKGEDDCVYSLMLLAISDERL
jgi:hypothetical protein